MSLIGAFFFILAIGFIWILPAPVLYMFSNLMCFFTYRIMGYRRDVVRKNLVGSFPGISEKEIERLTKLFYKNLADIFLEGIWAFTMSKKQILKRYKVLNPEVLEQFYDSGQSVIGVTGHYTNWEWGSLSASYQTKLNVVAFYKPMNNRYIDKIAKWNRSRFGTTLAPIKDTTLTFQKNKEKRTIYLMVSDQGMPKEFANKAYWIKFLNRDTAFLHGLEKHAKANNLPVVYIDIQRVKRGYYTYELSVLTSNPLELKDGCLTEMYVRKLESVILKKPENWLWSHNRWKLSR
jgi:KDO2-lipid IV(A) lauroyltransferase